jgi:TonB family protein
MSPLRLAKPPKDSFHRLSRQNILVFLALAAWLHLCIFMGLDRLGVGALGGEALGLPAPQPPLELTLEIAAPQPAQAALGPEGAPAPPEAATPSLGPPQDPARERIQEGPAADPVLEPAPAPDPAPQPAPDPLPEPGTLPEPSALGLAPPAELALRPEELLDPLDNQVKTFDLSGGTPILDGDEGSLGINPDSTVNVEESAPAHKSYDSQVRSLVARNWILPPTARNNFRPGRFSAAMTIDPNGDILSIVVRESAGNTALDYAAMEALRGAAPFPPFPEEYAHLSQRTFHMNFDYRAVVKSQAQAEPRP